MPSGLSVSILRAEPLFFSGFEKVPFDTIVKATSCSIDFADCDLR